MKNALRKLIPKFLLNIYHYKLALLGAFFYGFPSQKLVVFGVTGTNGKTTVVDFISKIFEEAGLKTASMSSVRFKIREKEWENKLKMTMPGRLKIQKFLKQAVKKGCTHAVLEVTSEGISQYRHKFINFTGAVFTNLSPEHVESHGGFEKYRACKEKLFKATKKIHIVNIDDKNAEYFLRYSVDEKYGYGIMNQESGISGLKFIKADKVEIIRSGFSFMIHNSLFKIPLLGEFNIYNALAAICAGISQGISFEKCAAALGKIKAEPGRMEQVIKEPFSVIVDYAHNPNALENVYKALTTNYKLQTNKLICVLGSCGGGRDKWKRPVLGELAGEYCNEVIVTNEDPYNDDPMEIINQVASGIQDSEFMIHNSYKILDRREAIKKAINLAKSGDVVVITGKGCEPWMCVAKGEKIPWDDRKIVKEELAGLNSSSGPSH